MKRLERVALAKKKRDDELRKQREKEELERRQKQQFYQHFDEVQTLVRRARDDEIITIVPIFKNALEDMTDFLQLKHVFTAVNAQYRLGTITSDDRRALIFASLEKAKDWCVSPFHVAMYRVGLRYALSERIISQFQYDQLDVAALECDIANTDYIQAMQTMIRQNVARIDRLENAHVLFQQAVSKSMHNLIALHQDMNCMATAINDTQAAFNKLAYKRRVEAGCSLVSAVLNAVSFGVAGTALQGILEITVAGVADFGDLAHLSGVLMQMSIPSEMLQEIGDTSIHDMLEHGVSLAADHADGKLDEVLIGENVVVVMAASAAVFTNALELDDVDEPAKGNDPIAGSSKVHSHANEPMVKVEAEPPSKEDLEKKRTRLENKRQRRISDAKLAKELGQDDHIALIMVEIQQLRLEIDDLDEQIDNS